MSTGAKGGDSTGSAAAAAARWRRTRPDDPTWPPPPPDPEAAGDILDAARELSGYIQALVEAIEADGGLAAGSRLALVATKAIYLGEELLDATQRDVNASLMGKDLGRVRLLTSARLLLYESVQRLKSLAAGARETEAPTRVVADPHAAPTRVGPSPDAATRVAPGPRDSVDEEIEDLVLVGPPTARATLRGPAAPRRPPPRRRVAEAPASGSRRFFAVAAVLVAVAGLAIVAGPRLWGRGDRAPAAPASAPPEMRWVTLKETRSGIVATPEAVDPDGDPVSFRVRWLVRGQVVPRAHTLRLRPSHYAPGDEVVVEVVPSDGRATGRPMRSRPLVARGGERRR